MKALYISAALAAILLSVVPALAPGYSPKPLKNESWNDYLANLSARTQPYAAPALWFEPAPPPVEPISDKYLKKLFNECRSDKKLCVIRFNSGGLESEFLSAAKEVLAGARDIVVIDGPCASGCVIFADKASAKVCITSRALFKFHMGRLYTDVSQKNFIGWEEPTHSMPIRAWVHARNGFPKSISKTLDMPSTEAANFWPVCQLNPPLPRARPKTIPAARKRGGFFLLEIRAVHGIFHADFRTYFCYPAAQEGPMRTKLAALIAFASYVLLTPAPAAIITNDPGGRIITYIDQYRSMRDTGERVVIDGACLSACTLVLGIVPRDRVCATPKAVLGFHAAWLPGQNGKQIPSELGNKMLLEIYPPNVRTWINGRGGLTSKMQYLRGRELYALLPRCKNGAAEAEARAPSSFTPASYSPAFHQPINKHRAW